MTKDEAVSRSKAPARPVFIGLGTNLPYHGLAGAALLEAALSAIDDTGVKVVKRSSFWASPALPTGGAPQPDFVNAVAEVDPGARAPDQLWAVLAGIERAFGRERRERWAARTLDLDIIDFAGMVSSGGEGELTLPHSGAYERAFVLAPLAEIAPDWRHPVSGLGVKVLLQALPEAQIRRIEPT